MAYISPNTDIYLLRGCPCDSQYSNTLHFESPFVQEKYFKSLRKPADRYSYYLPKYTYQRHNKNIVRVGINRDYLNDINYLMFRNTSYGDKWFYAFVTAVEYVNDNASEIYYTLDVLQSWYFDYTLMPCFVEREHSDSDEVGEHILDEGLDTGEDFNFTKIDYNTADWDELAICIASTYDITGFDIFNAPVSEWKTAAYTINGIPQACGFYIIGDAGTLNDIITRFNVVGKIDGILGVSVIPRASVDTLPNDLGYNANRIKGTKSINTSFQRSYAYKYSQYTPKNNKMYVYPYNFIFLTNNNGNNEALKVEHWGNKDDPLLTFATETAISLSPEIRVSPIDYNGMQINREESITIGAYPLGSFQNDIFSTWFAQNKSKLAQSVMSAISSTAITIAGAAISGGASPAMSGTVGGLPATVATGTALSTSLQNTALSTDVNTPINFSALSGAGNYNAGPNGIRVGGNVIGIGQIASLIATATDIKVIPPAARGAIGN